MFKTLNTKHCLLTVLSTCFLLIFGTKLHAAEISSFNGALNHGGELTISGSNFGAKSTAAPIKFDNFEWGAVSDLITTDTVSPMWEPDTPGGTDVAAISDTQAHAGSHSVFKDMKANNGDCAFYDAGIYFTGGTELYVSYWIRYESATGSDLTQPRADFFKLNRINSGLDIYGGAPSFLINLYPNYDAPETGRIEVHNYWDGVYDGKTANIGRYYNNDMRAGQWHRIEMYIKTSNPGGTFTGVLQWFFNSREIITDWSGNTVTRIGSKEPYDYITKAATSSDPIDTFSLLFGGCGYDQVERPLMWQDDVYVDNTRARVEIGDAPIWSDCTLREIQIPTTWNDGQIKISLNQGSMATLPDKYLFVIDAEGNVSNGYPLASPATPDIISIEIQ